MGRFDSPSLSSRKENTMTNRCDCMASSVIATCPQAKVKKTVLSLLKLNEVTNNIGNDNSLPNNFDGDNEQRKYANAEDEEITNTARECKNMSYYENILEKCSTFLRGSYKTVESLCIDLASHMELHFVVPILLRYLESRCEAAFISLAERRAGIIKEEIADLFRCPENCYGNGDCTMDGCACYPGFNGTECLKKAGTCKI